MVKPKTKEQKKQDQNNVFKTLVACAKACKEFTTDMYDSELDVRWMRIGVISELFDASRKYENAESMQQATHTFTSYEEDKDNDLWDKSTHIDRYKTD